MALMQLADLVFIPFLPLSFHVLLLLRKQKWNAWFVTTK
jgi:hypothetical protein